MADEKQQPRLKQGAIQPRDVEAATKTRRIRVAGFRGSYAGVRFGDNGETEQEVDAAWKEAFALDFPHATIEDVP